MPSSFRREPLKYFDEQLQTAEDAFWVRPSLLCVAEPTAAKAVLANADGHFEEHSDFFHTSRGPFGPRELQSWLGGSARRLLTAGVAERDPRLDESIDRYVGRSSVWPDAGNQLVFRHLRDLLVAPEHYEHIGPLIEEIVERSVLAGARERHSLISRFFFRRRAFAALTREIELRKDELSSAGRDAPRDLFDVLALSTRTEFGADVSSRDLGELYLPFFFAVVSSVGFTLAWAVYLLGTSPDAADLDAVDLDAVDLDAEPADIVRESLRLWPIAWQTGRKPARAHEIAGIEVTPKTEVLVSAYVTQRHPAYWSEPDRFLPGRWANAARSDHSAYFPFGWGPHTCAAASLSLQLASAAVARLRACYRLAVRPQSDRPYTGPSLAPPRFRLDLAPLNP